MYKRQAYRHATIADIESGYANASNQTLVHQQIANPIISKEKIVDVRFWDQKVAKTSPGTLIIGFALKNCAQKWSQVVKTLDG